MTNGQLLRLILVIVAAVIVIGRFAVTLFESTPSSSEDECVRSTSSAPTAELEAISCDDVAAEYRVGEQVDSPRECGSTSSTSTQVYMTKKTGLTTQTYCLIPLR